jgi:hypothetical protein
MNQDTVAWPLNPDGAPIEAVPLLTGIPQMDADMKAAMLGAFGVPARIAHSALNDRFTSVVFGNYLMLVDLFVPKGYEEEAAALLSSEGDADGEEQEGEAE